MADVINDVKSVGHTFSSWDSCMSKTYCKWPVIAAILIGSLIVLSVLWCIFSCLCCGLSICTACTKCLTCGGCCGACRSGGRRRKDPEYQAMPPTPTPYQGYQPQPQPSPMMYNNAGPQFATFDAATKKSPAVHEDSLPAMPSWENAVTRRVEDTTPQHHGRDMEMEHMLPQSQQHGSISPVREQPYMHSQPYSSDLGAQRLDQQQRGYSHDYYDPPSQPLSPAPTYYSTAPNVAAAVAPPSHGDHYSPQYDHYHMPYDNRGMTSSVAPYPSSRESTQFSAPRSLSPPSDQNQGVRPPSLLQIGRKPVAGSFREV